eukprot:784423-Pyramimonas_sp.AAC.1
MVGPRRERRAFAQARVVGGKCKSAWVCMGRARHIDATAASLRRRISSCRRAQGLRAAEGTGEAPRRARF